MRNYRIGILLVCWIPFTGCATSQPESTAQVEDPELKNDPHFEPVVGTSKGTGGILAPIYLAGLVAGVIPPPGPDPTDSLRKNTLPHPGPPTDTLAF
jgi:hypothetical protein